MQFLELKRGLVPLPSGDGGVHQFETDFHSEPGIGVRGQDPVSRLHRPQRLASQRPGLQQHAVRLHGTVCLGALGHFLGGYQPALRYGPPGRLKPQSGGPAAVARASGKTGRQHTGLALQIRQMRVRAWPGAWLVGIRTNTDYNSDYGHADIHPSPDIRGQDTSI